MEENKMMEVELTERKSSGFKRTVLLVGIAAVLGGGTMGGGAVAGRALMQRLLPAEDTAGTGETQPAFSFNNDDVDVVPINVKVPSFSGVVKEVKDSVVSINVSGETENMFFGTQTQAGAGSGIIFEMDDENVYVATNNHVVENMDTVSISLNDEDNVDARVVGTDPSSDLAVISASRADLDALDIPYKAAVFGDSSQVQIGEAVVALGNSLGNGQTVTGGMISATDKQITIEDKTLRVMQTDAAINMGNSGGPLVNDRAEVIGINTAKLSSSEVEGTGYCIPINDAKEILESLRINGVVKKPTLGITAQTVTADFANQFSLPTVGVLVRSVADNSGAAAAGLQSFDMITGIDGNTVETMEDLTGHLAGKKVDDEVTLDIYRGGEYIKVTVILGYMSE